jgi:hypothetical protein
MSGAKSLKLTVGVVHLVITILIAEDLDLPASINKAAERSLYGATSKKKLLLIINLLIAGIDSESDTWVTKDAVLMGVIVGHLLYIYKVHKDTIKEKLIRTLETATTRTEDGEWREDRYLVVMNRLKVLNNIFDMIEDLTHTPSSEWIDEDGITLLNLRY